MFPRSGAFEVYVDGHRIFSKIKSKRWPKFDRIVQTIKSMLDTKANSEDLASFDIDYQNNYDKLVPITNADLYDIKTIFRVRKSVNESYRQSRTLEPHEIMPKNGIFSHITNTNPEKNRYRGSIISKDSIQDWRGNTPSYDEKANIYLQEIYPKKATRDQKKKRIMMIKDDDRGSIVLQN